MTSKSLGCLIEDGSNDLSNDSATDDLSDPTIQLFEGSGDLSRKQSNDLVQQLRKSGPRLSTPNMKDVAKTAEKDFGLLSFFWMNIFKASTPYISQFCRLTNPFSLCRYRLKIWRSR